MPFSLLVIQNHIVQFIECARFVLIVCIVVVSAVAVLYCLCCYLNRFTHQDSVSACILLDRTGANCALRILSEDLLNQLILVHTQMECVFMLYIGGDIL